MLTTVCRPSFDLGALAGRIEVWRADPTGRVKWDDPAAARLRALPATVSVWKGPDGTLWCARVPGSELLAEAAAEAGALDGPWACAGPVPLAEVGDLPLAGLCLGALASHDGTLLGTYSEFQGRLLSMDASRHKGRSDAHGLLWDIEEEPGLGPVLTFRTVSLLACGSAKWSGRKAARAWAEKAPKDRGTFPLPLYEVTDDGRVARHPAPEKAPKGLWFQGARQGSRYNKMPFFANTAAGWDRSKCRALRLMLLDTEEVWGRAFSLGLQDIDRVCGPAIGNATSLAVSQRVWEGGPVRLRAHKEVDEAAFPGAMDAVAAALAQCGCQLARSGSDLPELLVIHERDWALRPGADPHERRRGHPVQCLTIESLWTAMNEKDPGAAVATLARSCVKELAVKRGLAAGTAAGAAPKGAGGWSLFAPLPKKEDGERVAWGFVDVGDDLSLSFEAEDDVDLFGFQGERGAMSDASDAPGGERLPLSFVARDPRGNICRARSTCAYALPDLDKAERLAREAEARFLAEGKSPAGAYMSRRAEDKEAYAAVLDCSWLPLGDGAALYWSGIHGAGINSKPLRGAPLRVLEAVDGSSLPDPQAFLALLAVDFVRLAEPTVRPWPLKYLDEWARSDGRLA